MKYIYVLDENGKPLMPTKRLGMVRRWLKSGEAHWYKNRRDTIQFNRKTADYTQETVLGCDLGDHLGISVIANNQEIYSGESYCNGNETHQKMQKRKMYRRTRRNRLRHRQARFNNRKKSGYAPSINRKLQFQIREIQRLTEFLPISKMIFEGSVFDINKLTHHTQQQKGYKTTFDFLYARDNGCDALDGKHYPKSELVIHHLVHRANGGTNNPDNLVLLSRVHHNQSSHNNGVLDNLTKQRQETFKNADTRGAYFMNILNVELPKHFNYIPTFGYITANKRKLYNIKKTHHDDAFVIAGGTDQTERLNYTVYRTKVSNNNRSLERFYDATYLDLRDSKKKKGAVLSSGRTGRSRKEDYNNQRIYRANKIRKGKRSIRTSHYFIQVHDLVKYNNHIFSSRGMQNHGLYVRLLAQPKDKVVSIKKITCVKHVNGLITEIK